MPSMKSRIKKLFLNGGGGGQELDEKLKESGEQDLTARSTCPRGADVNTGTTGTVTNITATSNSSTSTFSETGTLELPIVDYKDISQIPDILIKYPAIYLINHGLPPAPFSHARTLLTLPKKIKDTLRDPKSTVHGYNNAKASGREWWDYNPAEKLLGPPDDEEFKKDTTEFFNQSIKMLQNICQQFNSRRQLIPQEVSEDVGFSTMRYLRYSPDVIDQQPQNPDQSTYNTVLNSHRADDNGEAIPHIEAHTDLDILTLITATEPSGLYVWNRRGEVFSAPPIDGTVLIMAGDLMPFFTSKPGKSPLDQHEGIEAIGEDTVLPTAHTVVVPRSAGERYSIAVFLRPRRDIIIDKRVVKRGEKEVEEETAFWWLATEKLHVEGRKCFLA
ncbi:hypothetical protein EYR41_008953 [Orbilia oligospora]|uniref:Uncharacterized protein n=1 Tax=Orbilia oligospora TaxID=2813651 RepID=A0A7C8KK77_ORBOL|nr:hypothetical protein TWF751_003988 [Orbilia oligospora]TGJ64948.1 hypothetical protein EYR41_008953 [Orbilia oligospora]